MEFEEKENNISSSFFDILCLQDVAQLGGRALLSPSFLIIVLAILFYYYITTFTRSGWMLRKFPSVPRYPFVGSIPHAPLTPQDLASSIEEGVERLGRRFVFWLGHKPYLHLMDADSVQKVFSSPKYIQKGSDYKQFEWVMGNGLVTSNGHIWKEDRKLLGPYFKYQKFDGFLEHFNKYSKILVKILGDLKGKETNLHPYLCRATMDFITEAALGQSSSYQYDLDAEFMVAVNMTLNIFRTRLLKPWLTLPFIWNIFGLGKEEKHCSKLFSEHIRQLVDKRKKVLEEGGGGGEDVTKPFIDALLDTKSYKDITSHIVTIFGAGFETTGSGMNYTLFLLALEPQCLAKVHAELDLVLGQEDDLTFSHLSELKYLEMCIKESLRLFPPVPALIRCPQEDIPLDNNQTIPQGVETLFLVRELHRDPTHFPEPNLFLPERFLPSACATRHPYAYIPFSAGPRNCLGMKYAMVQMKSCLAHVLKRFTLSTNQTREELKVIYGMVLEPYPSLKVALTPR